MTDLATPEADSLSASLSKLRSKKNGLKPVGQIRNHWYHKAVVGAGPDELRDQLYWGPVSHLLTRHDIITVFLDDESQELELCVERVLNGAAEVSVRKVYSRTGVAHAGRSVDDLGEYGTEFRAGQGWCVVRRKDDTAILKGFAMEAGAIAEWHRTRPRKVQ